METTGEKIRRLRLAAGLTQQELAKKAGISLPGLRHYEQEKRMPRLDHAQAIAAALDVTLNDVAGSSPAKRSRNGGI